jgi:cytochrome c oxidase subunit IV
MKYEMRKFGVFPTARILAILYAMLGLLLSPFLILASFLGPEEDRFSLVFALLLPALYGVLGFVMTAVGAVVYNFIAGLVGGIEVELNESNVGETFTPGA